MQKLARILALSAAIGGATSMLLVASDLSNSQSLPIFVLGMIITLGALASARRLAGQDLSTRN
jgi:hypothetical protein